MEGDSFIFLQTRVREFFVGECSVFKVASARVPGRRGCASRAKIYHTQVSQVEGMTFCMNGDKEIWFSVRKA